MLRLILALALPGLATADVLDFEGDYPLGCDLLVVNLHAGLAVGAGDQLRSGGVDLELPLRCDPIEAGDADWAEVFDAVADACDALDSPALDCDALATGVADRVAAVNNATVAHLPRGVELTVRNAHHWIARLLRLYSIELIHRFEEGEPAAIPALLSDRPGWRNGRFAAFRVGLGPLRVGDGWGCGALGLGTIDGQVRRAQDLRMEYALGVAGEFVCAAAGGGAGAAVVLGVSVRGKLSSRKGGA